MQVTNWNGGGRPFSNVALTIGMCGALEYSFIRLNPHVAQRVSMESSTLPSSRRRGLASLNMKMLGLTGATLIAVGIAGMIVVSTQAREALADEQLWAAEGFWFQMKDYAFMFTMIAGLILVIYAHVATEREKAKLLGNAP